MTQPGQRDASFPLIPEALAKTGFLLEHKVSELFRAAGFSIIGNRYYVDDVDGRTRELDLVAYRVTKQKEFDVVTAALVSCKKDAEHTWAFMSVPRRSGDPNIDPKPCHTWTDCEPLRTYLKDSKWRDSYFSSIGGSSSVFESARQSFGMQLISPDGLSPRNDKPMFDSISGLMKALSYELSALAGRMSGRRRVYQLNLVTVVDAPLVDVQYEALEPQVVPVEWFPLYSSYLVDRKNVHGLIHFVRYASAAQLVGTLAGLAEVNGSAFSALQAEAFGAIKNNDGVQQYFAARLLTRLSFSLNDALSTFGIAERITELHLEYDEEREVLRMQLDSAYGAADLLNDHDKVRKRTTQVLKDVARYEGKFEFEAYLPF